MPINSRAIILSAFIVVAGLAAAAYVSSFAVRQRPGLPAGLEDQDLGVQGKNLKGFMLGAEGLLADWYWMASLQYLGEKVVRARLEAVNIEDLRPLNPRLLYPYLDNATDLDPRFLDAHYYGAIVLPAIDPALAIKLTEKGIAKNPDAWRLYQYLGYIYWRLNDYEKAAEVYEKGAQIAGAPPFMKFMAASMRNKGGSRDTARAIYSQMLEDASDETTRETAELRLAQLDSLDEREVIDAAIDAFRQRNGRCPVSLFEAIPFLKNMRPASGKDLKVDRSGNIVDPTGVPYVLDNRECKAAISFSSKVPRV